MDQIGEIADGLGHKRVMLVTDVGIVAAGHVARAVDSLQQHGIETHVFDGAHENPTTADVDAGLAFAKECQPELLIGLGGGSSMDCAKGVNFVYSCGGTMHDYAGVGKATEPMLPMIAVPTTAGTGSEMQSFALISDADTHVKMACGDKKASCRVAVLDPLLTLTQPKMVTVLTGIDAISHAVETMVTTKRNPVSGVFSQAAWRLLSNNFSHVINSPTDLPPREAMQLGAAWSGVAIENSMLGAAHALSNPLTARFGIIHGQAVGLMLPHVVRFNGQMEGCETAYRQLLGQCSVLKSFAGEETERPQSAAEQLADFLQRLLKKAGLKTTLSELGVSSEEFPSLAADASRQWTGTFNPVPVDETSLLQIYRNAS